MLCGYLENDVPRMVKTPWSEENIPFEKAAEIGTKKVITEHATVGIVVTTDGSITEIPREEYIKAEERVIQELKIINKPFVMILNSKEPESIKCQNLVKELEKKYETQIISMNCEEMNLDNLNTIFSKLLFEFNVDRININMPKWINGLPLDNELKYSLFTTVKNTFSDVQKLIEVQERYKLLKENNENIDDVQVGEIDLSKGVVRIDISLQENLFYDVLSNTTGVNIRNEEELFSSIIEFSKIKKEYDKMSYALHEVNERGYGIVNPGIDDLILDEPEIVKQGSKYGVKLKAKAPSIHMLKIETETEVSPIVGSERQSEDLVKYLLSEFESDPKKIWESNIFGKSLHELVNEGLQNKLARMPEDAQGKLRDTIERIVNEGSGGLICIIL